MERSALSLRRTAPAPRAARKSEWLRSALAYHHGAEADTGADNEIVVLATGIDQYLQEVFHHLAYPNQDDQVSAEDFAALCAVLGLTDKRRWAAGRGDETLDEDDEEFMDVCSCLPAQLSFKDFHSRLCGYFRVRAARRGTGECAARLPRTEETELVERQIRIRWPRVRRRKYVTFDLNGHNGSSTRGRGAEEGESGEVGALRELVEDLRSALQGSDARCLALEVALRRAKCRGPPPAASTIAFAQLKPAPTQRIRGSPSTLQGAARTARDPLLRELRLIRSSRDGQLEEAIRFNQRLEEEVRWAHSEVRRLQELETTLRRENTHIRRRAEEAREALSLGLQRVRTIQEQAQSVPQLQDAVGRLEAELHHYRSRCICMADVAQQDHYSQTASKTQDSEYLQRAVEGRAASDEEEERETKEEGQRRCSDAKKLMERLHDCGAGCQNHSVHEQQQHHKKNLSNTSVDHRRRCGCQTQSPDSRRASSIHMRAEQGAEVLEEKFRDALTLLLQLHNKRVSHCELERILLEVCGGDGPLQVLQVADALGIQLCSTDLHGNGAEEAGGSALAAGSASGGALLISC